MSFEVAVSRSGPLFDGRAPAAAFKALDEAKLDLADRGVAMLLRLGLESFESHPTMRWETELNTRLGAYNDVVIYDPVIYNAWLEGVSKRNQSTKFKGYHLFRRTAQDLQRLAVPVMEQHLDAHMAEMGGTP